MEEKVRFSQKPMVRALIGFGVLVAIYFILGFYMGSVDPNTDQSIELLSDLALCIAGLMVWMVFFAQFVLPVSKLGDRLNVVDRLVTYLMGGHGPALFIENGFVREREGESEKHGPGVIWLDSASAAVLRTEAQFTQTVGPGVHFTKAGEYIAGTADLHTLTQSTGPEDTDEPFTVTKTHENYQKMQERRWATSGTTRDAIEVVAAISVVFRIKSADGEGGTRFGFNPANSESAIRDSITRGVKLNQPVCSPLPAKMAVDIWREYLHKVRLSELFEIVDWGSETTLQFIAGLVKNRLNQESVVLLDDFGRPCLKGVGKGKFDEQRFLTYCQLRKAGKNELAESMLEKIPSQEFKTLTAMGIEVTAAGVKRLIFAPEVEERLIKEWTALWLKNAQKEHELVERDRKLAEIAGNDEALKEFAQMVIKASARQAPGSKSEALIQIVHSSLTGLLRNATLLKRTTTEQRDLSDMIDKLREGETRP
jgi:hypothetical protein